MEQEEEKIPYTYTGFGNSTVLCTIGGLEYRYGPVDGNFKQWEKEVPQIAAFNEFLSEIPTVEERKEEIMKEFRLWETKDPSITFALWLIEQYKVADINWRRDQRRLKLAAEGREKSWEELLKERDEEISELKSQLREKDAIITQKTKEHDDYVANHSTSDDDGTEWLMKINKEDIYLSLKEYTIILYTLFRHASGKEKLTANQKRLIGSYNTVDAYINHSKKEGKHPLTEDEKNRIKKVLNSEQIPYQEILKDYL